MANALLQDLSAATTLAGTDLFYVKQSGARGVKATGTQLLALVGTAYVPLAGGTMTGALTLPAGAAGAPSLLFTGAGTTTGIFAAGATALSIASSGVAVVMFNNSTTRFRDSTQSDAILLEANTAFIGLGTSNDVRFGRDAAATLAQRNGTNAQTLRIYGTYTDSSNYERLSLSTTAGTSVNITAETLGTGGDNLNIVLTPAGTGVLTTGAYFRALGIVAGGSTSLNEYAFGLRVRSAGEIAWCSSSLGTSVDLALFRGAAGQVDVTNGTVATYRDLKLRNLLNVEYHEMTEMTAPSAPATNSVRIYAEDNGSGKTRLMALFATGAAQQIAIEP